jgi:hypothetical protein
MAIHCRQLEGTFAKAILHLRLCPIGPNQQSDNLPMPPLDGQMDGHLAIVILGIQIGIVLQKELHNWDRAMVRGPMEWRIALHICGIHIGPMGQEELDHGHFVVIHGIGEGTVTCKFDNM